MTNLLPESANDLRRNSGTAALYVTVTVGILVLFRISDYLLYAFEVPVNAPGPAALARIVLALSLAAATSAAQAVIFAMLGAEIARPMWKCSGWRDALERFFLPWLIINLFLVTIIDIRTHLFSIGELDLAGMLELILLAAHLAAMPVGASIMFWGALNWRELPAALSPLARFVQLALAPVAFAFLQYVLIGLRAQLMAGSGAGALVLYAVTDIPLVLMDVFVFILIWRICLLNQTTPKEVDEDPLDF